VTNPENMPALTNSTDNPGRAAYQSSVKPTCANQACSGVFPAVPAGHRLVVEQVSAGFGFNPASGPLVVRGRVGSSNLELSFFVPIQSLQTFFVQPILAYFDSGITPFVAVDFISGAVPVGPTGPITLTGYLLDCTASPCAPIAQ
jgi:hypothetical protein